MSGFTQPTENKGFMLNSQARDAGHFPQPGKSREPPDLDPGVAFEPL
jgi:hypothetical protein